MKRCIIRVIQGFLYIILYIPFFCYLLRAHWYLVVICFPGLDEPKSEAWNGPYSQMEKSDGAASELQDQEVAPGSKSPNDNPETPPTLTHSDSMDAETGVFD